MISRAWSVSEANSTRRKRLRCFHERSHVNVFGMLYRRGHSGEVTHRPHTRIEVEHLTQRDVQASNPAAHGSSQRPLIATANSAMALTESSVNHSPNWLNAFSPANISYHTIRRPPP